MTEQNTNKQRANDERVIKALEFKAAVDVEARTFEGYASTFGNVDQVGDIITPGAFAKTIQERFPKGDIKILWQHYEPLGMPIEIREDERGLYVKGRISKTALGDDALELMRDGVVNRMSIGITIVKADYDDQTGNRIIREVKLWEFSPVTFPANEQAVITAVKHLSGMLSQAGRDEIMKVQPEESTALIESKDDPELIQSVASFCDEIIKTIRSYRNE